jgi:hypothetical protein
MQMLGFIKNSKSMKKNTLCLIVLLFTNIHISGQNKKEQIDILDQRIDSLLIVTAKQSNTIKQLVLNISELNEKLSNFDKDYSLLNEIVKKDKIELAKKDLQIAQIAKAYDSLSILLYNQYANSTTEWTRINIDETIRGFSFSKNLILSYNGKPIKGVVIRKNATTIMISPCSYDNRWVIVHTYQNYIEEWEQPGFFICDLFSNIAYNIKTGCPMLWLSWSPNLKNVLIGSYYESDMTLYNIEINPLKISEIEFDADIAKDANGYSLEELFFEEESVKWISENSVNIIVNILNEERTVKLRSYTFTLDTQTNKIIDKKLNDLK